MIPSDEQTLSWIMYVEEVAYGNQTRIYLLHKVDFDKCYLL